MKNKNIVILHGKEYMTVAGRIELAHEKEEKLSIVTELLPLPNAIVVKATVTTSKGVFTGISYANFSKAIEKVSPYEVAETSAVGRALGFAGFGLVEGVATADEIVKAESAVENKEDLGVCAKCGAPNKWSQKYNKPYCSAICWNNKN